MNAQIKQQSPQPCTDRLSSREIMLSTEPAENAMNQQQQKSELTCCETSWSLDVSCTPDGGGLSAA